jgi:signal transduction histidine kinase
MAQRKGSTDGKNIEEWAGEESSGINERFLKLDQKARSLENSVGNNNYLLEYKQKDLLVQANLLEDALEEISIRNKELQAQKLRILEQAESLRLSHQEILEKNHELEQQTESLLDQAEYLHEANQTITDMHGEVQRQKMEIEEKRKELEVLNQEKNNLIGIVAHDLKSPLNQIKGLLDIVKKAPAPLDSERLMYIDMIERSATRLSGMINNILDVEAIESRKLNLNIERVNLSGVMADLVGRYMVGARQKQVEVFVSQGSSVFADVDRGLVEQVFENILSNALKFSPPSRNVYVRLLQQDGKAITEIKDEGPGLNEEDKKKLFGKYQKLSAKPTGDETSTGLGLSIVKKFVEAMGGEIWCQSEAGNGASFFVAFAAIG